MKIIKNVIQSSFLQERPGPASNLISNILFREPIMMPLKLCDENPKCVAKLNPQYMLYVICYDNKKGGLMETKRGVGGVGRWGQKSNNTCLSIQLNLIQQTSTSCSILFLLKKIRDRFGIRLYRNIVLNIMYQICCE